MKDRSAALETAVLGLLAQAPLHGYELRKRLNLLLGSFRALSYGSLYPCLRSLAERGLIESTTPTDEPRKPLAGSRSRTVYRLTAHGRAQLTGALTDSGPAAWEDETFQVRFALFGRTDAETRLRILEGRRLRLTERFAAEEAETAQRGGRVDEYERELQRHGLERVEQEIAWLDALITSERARTSARDVTPPAADESRPGQPTKEQG